MNNKPIRKKANVVKSDCGFAASRADPKVDWDECTHCPGNDSLNWRKSGIVASQTNLLRNQNKTTEVSQKSQSGSLVELHQRIICNLRNL